MTMTDYRKRLDRLSEKWERPSDGYAAFCRLYEGADALSKAIWEVEAQYCLDEEVRAYLIRMGVLPADTPRHDIYALVAEIG